MLEFKDFENSMLGLSEAHQEVLLLALCERMYYQYEVFSKKYNLNSLVLRAALDSAWRYIEGGTSIDLMGMSKKCENIAPDTEDYEDILASSALDACVAVSLFFKFLKTHDKECIRDILTLARDTIDMFIQESDSIAPSDPYLDAKIESHILSVSEKSRQAKDIQAAVTAKNITNLTSLLKKAYYHNDIGLIE